MAARRGVAVDPAVKESVPRLHSGVVPTRPKQREDADVKRSEAPTMPPPAAFDPRRDTEGTSSGRFPKARVATGSSPNLEGASTDTVTADLRRDPRADD